MKENSISFSQILQFLFPVDDLIGRDGPFKPRKLKFISVSETNDWCEL